MTANPYTDYTDEDLLAAVARHAQAFGLTMDLAYRTVRSAPEELAADQFKDLVAELELRGACGAGDLFTDPRGVPK